MTTTNGNDADPEFGESSTNARNPPTIAAIQADVAQANSYRLELVKTVLTLATALFAFTVSFPVGRASGAPVNYGWLGWVSWGCLAASILAGLVHMRLWEAFYISYRDFDHKQKRRGAGKCRRAKITTWRRAAMVIQYVAFSLGVVAVGFLAAVNTEY